MPDTPTSREILDLPMPDNDANAATIRDYLTELLTTLWEEKELFDSKRPFGNSDWQYDIYHALVQAGWVDGVIDDDGYLDTFDIENGAHADQLITTAIRHLGETDD